jgi:hypothetical protein
VIADGDVAVAELFDPLQELGERAVIGTDEVLRQVRTELHHRTTPDRR